MRFANLFELASIRNDMARDEPLPNFTFAACVQAERSFRPLTPRCLGPGLSDLSLLGLCWVWGLAVGVGLVGLWGFGGFWCFGFCARWAETLEGTSP